MWFACLRLLLRPTLKLITQSGFVVWLTTEVYPGLAFPGGFLLKRFPFYAWQSTSSTALSGGLFFWKGTGEVEGAILHAIVMVQYLHFPPMCFEPVLIRVGLYDVININIHLVKLPTGSVRHSGFVHLFLPNPLMNCHLSGDIWAGQNNPNRTASNTPEAFCPTAKNCGRQYAYRDAYSVYTTVWNTPLFSHLKCNFNTPEPDENKPDCKAIRFHYTPIKSRYLSWCFRKRLHILVHSIVRVLYGV